MPPRYPCDKKSRSPPAVVGLQGPDVTLARLLLSGESSSLGAGSVLGTGGGFQTGEAVQLDAAV